MSNQAITSDISSFLAQAKRLIAAGDYVFVPRGKNLQALSDHGVQMTKDRAKACNERREILRKALLELSFVKKIFPSDANFLLVEFNDGPKVFDAMAQKGVILRSFETKKNLKNCIRITIGSDSELEELMRYLKALEN